VIYPDSSNYVNRPRHFCELGFVGAFHEDYAVGAPLEDIREARAELISSRAAPG
jgi:hypothetical protein